MNENNVNSKGPQVSPREEVFIVDFKQLRLLLVSHWQWLVASVFVSVLLACVYLWLTPTTVNVIGKMEIIDKSKKGGGGMSAGLAMLNSLPLGLGSSLSGAVGAAGSIDSEKEIILSNALVTDVVKDLNLYTEYHHCKWGKKTLLYQNNPVNVSLDEAHVAWLDSELPLYNHKIKLTITKDNDGYEVEPTLIENKEKTKMPTQSFAQLPAVIKTDAGTLTLTENKLTPKQAKPFEGGYTLKVVIAPPTKVADEFIKHTGFDAPSKKVTNLANISLVDESPLRAIDYINKLVEAYNKRANDDKNAEALKTDEFVNARLAKIDAELGSSDAAWENSKKNFQITTPEVDAEEALTKKSLYEAKLVEIGTQLQLHDYLNEYINNPANLYEIIPSGFSASASNSSEGKGDINAGGGNAALIAQHNTLVKQRKDLLKSVSEMSPQVQRLTESIKELHPTLQLAMKRDRQQLMMHKDAVNREFAKYSGRIGSAPQMERVLTEIGRQREIKQGVYLLMLQKREETAMELANTTDKGKFVDDPKVDFSSRKPQKKTAFFVALFFGTVLPMVVLYLLHMFKTVIDTRDELSAASKLPILAELDKDNVDDAIRTLRTNLLLSLKENKKVLLVASANNGDGKTFIAKKLEESLIAIGKKVTFVNGDLRNTGSKLHPMDVLASVDFAQQMSDAKASSDYVIIDSPALGEYSDAYQLSAFADATLYVVKAGQTDKSAIAALAADNKLSNPLLVLNK